ncbi:MAG: hypothetical protein IGQ88_08775 [Gloeomargaritaceae cyanobacterium C42_A2020_066]|nr:hypothetical protein [Gloeomargaritaceae cyanobacterium C42_A2020_066]
MQAKTNRFEGSQPLLVRLTGLFHPQFGNRPAVEVKEVVMPLHVAGAERGYSNGVI